ncbi:MAG: FtsQ-type POTRA domain-containing protein [Nitrospirota bacterium]|nr:FtsQ-type POTRA domain-containing protein [Nitrospirota bacterium]
MTVLATRKAPKGARQNARRNVRRVDARDDARRPRTDTPAVPSRRGRRRWLLASGLACAVLLAAGVFWGYGELRSRGLLTVQRIEINGNARIPEGQLLIRLHLPKHASLPELDVQSVSRQLLTHPWVERVAVRRSYPSTLSIRVWERTPRLLLTDAGGTPRWMVDGEGAVLDHPGPADLLQAGESQAEGLLAVSGVPLRGLAPGSRVDPDSIRLALDLAAAWGKPDVSVDLTDPRDPLLLSDGLRIRLGNQGGYDWRLARLEQLRPQLQDMGGKRGTEVDLRYDDRVVAHPL